MVCGSFYTVKTVFTQMKTIPVKNIPNLQSSLLGHLCCVSVVNNGGYYSLFSENARKQNLSGRSVVLLNGTL